MRAVAILGDKGGTTKTASTHLLCLGAYLHGVPAAYVLTDPTRKVRGEGRPYAVLDGRLPEQLALIFDSSRSNLNGWLFIDGGGNRPDFDVEVARQLRSSRSFHSAPPKRISTPLRARSPRYRMRSLGPLPGRPTPLPSMPRSIFWRASLRLFLSASSIRRSRS